MRNFILDTVLCSLIGSSLVLPGARVSERGLCKENTDHLSG